MIIVHFLALALAAVVAAAPVSCLTLLPGLVKGTRMILLASRPTIIPKRRYH